MRKILKKYAPIIYSFAAIVIFLSALKQFDGVLWHWMDAIITIGTVIGVWYNYNENQQQRIIESQKIPIIFDVEKNGKYKLDLDISRKEITRSEIQGMLAAFQKDIKARYSLVYLSDISFLDDIFKIQNNQINQLNIKVDHKEFEQFNLYKMKKL